MSIPEYTGKSTLVLRSSNLRLKYFFYSMIAFLFVGGMTSIAIASMIKNRAWGMLFVIIPFTLISLGILWFAFSCLSDLFKPSVKICISPRYLRLGTTANISWSISEPLDSLSIYLVATETKMTKPRTEKTLTHIKIAAEDQWENIIRGERSFNIPIDSCPSLSSINTLVEWILHVDGKKKDRHAKFSDYFQIKVMPQQPQKWHQALLDKFKYT